MGEQQIATSQMEAKWALRSYFKNGDYVNRFEHLYLDIEGNKIRTMHSEDDKLWPKQLEYEKIAVTSGNYFHRSDGLIFEVKKINERELHIDILVKSLKDDQVNSHLFYFTRYDSVL